MHKINVGCVRFLVRRSIYIYIFDKLQLLVCYFVSHNLVLRINSVPVLLILVLACQVLVLAGLLVLGSPVLVLVLILDC